MSRDSGKVLQTLLHKEPVSWIGCWSWGDTCPEGEGGREKWVECWSRQGRDSGGCEGFVYIVRGSVWQLWLLLSLYKTSSTRQYRPATYARTLYAAFHYSAECMTQCTSPGIQALSNSQQEFWASAHSAQVKLSSSAEIESTHVQILQHAINPQPTTLRECTSSLRYDAVCCEVCSQRHTHSARVKRVKG